MRFGFQQGTSPQFTVSFYLPTDLDLYTILSLLNPFVQLDVYKTN